MAIASGTGISKGSALTVANMLLPNFGAVSLASLQDLQLREDTFDDVSCHRISGQDSQGYRYELHIGTDDYLLRCKSINRGKNFSREIRRDIQTDHRIDENLFHVCTAT